MNSTAAVQLRDVVHWSVSLLLCLYLSLIVVFLAMEQLIEEMKIRAVLGDSRSPKYRDHFEGEGLGTSITSAAKIYCRE